MKQFCGHLVSSNGQSTIKVKINHILVLFLQNPETVRAAKLLTQMLVLKKKKG